MSNRTTILFAVSLKVGRPRSEVEAIVSASPALARALGDSQSGGFGSAAFYTLLWSMVLHYQPAHRQARAVLQALTDPRRTGLQRLDAARPLMTGGPLGGADWRHVGLADRRPLNRWRNLAFEPTHARATRRSIRYVYPAPRLATWATRDARRLHPALMERSVCEDTDGNERRAA